ncbi:GtrA family protein [Lacticaseibacillus absianus]|uniref:GtrA family protein n=1 Tax=Lacticaseibacillus absianus TaxID=2729623 RepID=UPI0015C73F3B|nr:GtrA family protein [Lacticaseibacillus absianus]
MALKLKQFIQFGLVGGLNTLLTYLLYLALYRPLTPTLAMAIGYGATSLLGLALNHRVFKATATTPAIVGRYYSTYAFTWLLSVGLTTLWTTGFAGATPLAPAFSLMVTIPVNFLLSKYWIFNEKGVVPHAKN